MGRAALVLAMGLWTWASALGCAFWLGAEPLPEAAVLVSPEPRMLRVTLHFGDAADLDLYVTDPLEETVYFANSPSSAGGVLEADERCSSPAPRVETVRFPNPRAGRYRVGVDYPERCRAARDPVPFLVVVEYEAERSEWRGEVSIGEFNPVVIELNVD